MYPGVTVVTAAATVVVTAGALTVRSTDSSNPPSPTTPSSIIPSPGIATATAPSKLAGA